MNVLFHRKIGYITVLSILFNIILIIYLWQIRHPTYDYHHLPYSLSRDKLYKILPITANDYVFIGDSQVQNFDLQEFLNGWGIKNRGINGDVTIGVYNRIDDVISDHPKKIFIEVGTNDIYVNAPIDTSVYYMNKIVERIKKQSPGTKIFIQSVFPREAMFKEKIVELNKRLSTLCQSTNITYINLYDKFSDNGVLNKSYDSGDHLHLSGAGYILWSEALKVYL